MDDRTATTMRKFFGSWRIAVDGDDRGDDWSFIRSWSKGEEIQYAVDGKTAMISRRLSQEAGESPWTARQPCQLGSFHRKLARHHGWKDDHDNMDVFLEAGEAPWTRKIDMTEWSFPKSGDTVQE